jgi:hypothetical protein
MKGVNFSLKFSVSDRIVTKQFSGCLLAGQIILIMRPPVTCCTGCVGIDKRINIDNIAYIYVKWVVASFTTLFSSTTSTNFDARFGVAGHLPPVNEVTQLFLMSHKLNSGWGHDVFTHWQLKGKFVILHVCLAGLQIEQVPVTEMPCLRVHCQHSNSFKFTSCSVTQLTPLYSGSGLLARRLVRCVTFAGAVMNGAVVVA